MSDRRYNAHRVTGTNPDRAIQLVRTYDGRIFSMSNYEARTLAYDLEKAAGQYERSRDGIAQQALPISTEMLRFAQDCADPNFSLSVPPEVKAVIAMMVEELSRFRDVPKR